MEERFASYEEACSFITNYEDRNVCKLIVYKRTKDIDKERLDTIHRVVWEERQGELPIPFDGVPFVIVGKEERECQHGPKRKKSSSMSCEDRSNEDHSYTVIKRRRHHQNTKKMDCPFKLKMRIIIRFPGYAMDGPDTPHRRRRISEKLKQEINDTTVQEYCVFLKVIGQHENHEVGELAGYGLPLAKQTKDKIKELVVNGLTDVEEIKRQIEGHFKQEKPDISITNRQYFPTSQDVRNHVFLTLNNNRYSKDDQTNLHCLIESWKEKNPQDSFFYRMGSCNPDQPVETLLFVHQSCFQRRMLQKYGNDVVVMDSTYNTSKYELPLYFLCVLTNVGYMVVATFIIGRDSTFHIKEALTTIKDWNSQWMPQSFMVDMDNREIGAIEDIFKEAKVYICEFHREQAWDRWLSKRENGVHACKDETIKYLRQIAHSRTESELADSIEALRESSMYRTNKRLSSYIERHWLAKKERWVRCYCDCTTNLRVNTTNGVEILNRLFKHKYLRGKGSAKTLSHVVTVITQTFVPEMRERYIRENILPRESRRKYSSDIPLFLRNRPPKFVRHCMERLKMGEEFLCTEIDNGFKVKSQSGMIYLIDFTKPVCSCPDFQKYFWPCKHMLNIMDKFPAFGWDFLPEDYKSNPLFNLDMDPESTSVDMDQNANSVPISTQEKSSKRDHLIANMKELLNSVYVVEDHILNEVEQYILAAADCVKRIHLAPMPLRHSRKRKRMPLLFADEIHGIKKKRCSKVLDDNFKEPLPVISLNDRSSETDLSTNYVSPCLPDYFHLEDQQDLQTGIKAIWYKRHEVENRMIGPYTLTTDSFRCIKSFLSDEVIDSFLHKLVQKHQTDPLSIYHLNCITMTSIFYGQKSIHHCLKRMPSLARCQTIIGAYNQDNCHWCLIIIRPVERRILFLNPLGTLDIQRQDIVLKWYNFLRLRHMEGLDNDYGQNWDLTIPNHAKQQDGSSCGVYVLKFAENYLSGKPLDFHWKTEQVQKARLSLAVFLLSASESSQSSTAIDQSTELTDCKVIGAEVNIPTDDMGIDDVLPPNVEDYELPPNVEDYELPPNVEDDVLPSNVEDDELPPNVEDYELPPNVEDDVLPSNAEDDILPPNVDDVLPAIVEDDVLLPNVEDDELPPNVEGDELPPNVEDDVLPSNVDDVLPAIEDDVLPANVEDDVLLPNVEKKVLPLDDVLPLHVEDDLLPQDVPRQEDTLTEDLYSSKEETQTRKKGKRISSRRLQPKRKMSNFIYPLLKKEPKVYCKCQKPYDGSFMIFCDLCQDWFHPSCINKERNELPEEEKPFFCPDCCSFVIPDVFQDPLDEEETHLEDDFFINMKTASQHFATVLERIYSIVSADKEKKSDKPWLKRHRLFRSGNLEEHHGYGFAVFSQKMHRNFSLMAITDWLDFQATGARFDYLLPNLELLGGAYVKNDYVVALKDQMLCKVIQKDSYLASVYCDRVLCKEALTAIFQAVTGAEYEYAEQECSEINHKSLMKAINEGSMTCQKKKRELTEKFN